MNIIQDEKAHRFCVDMNGEISFISYKKQNGSIEYYKTFVPVSLRHRGIAGKLVKFALDYAKENKLKVIPSCPFVKDYLDKNPT